MIPALDERAIDWARATSVTYLVQQRFRYEYPGTVRDLAHRLVVVPPDRHGDQRTVASRVGSTPVGECRRVADPLGNVLHEVTAPEVGSWIELEARFVVRRAGLPAREAPVAAGLPADPRMLEPTALTAPTPELAAAAADLRATGLAGPALAEAACAWTHGALTYEWGATDVRTPAGEALARGRGVCQDYAHVMLALCRPLGLPARYVSGHVTGEGGTHAWVEVLLPAPAGPGALAYAFDPTHGGRAGPGHVTVATGRDYRDVAPTAGTYVGAPGGRLTAWKRMDVIRVEYGRPPMPGCPRSV